MISRRTAQRPSGHCWQNVLKWRLRLWAHALALPLFYDSIDSAFTLHAVSPTLHAGDIEDSRSVKCMLDQQAAWQGRLPEDEAALWDWLWSRTARLSPGLSPAASPAP